MDTFSVLLNLQVIHYLVPLKLGFSPLVYPCNIRCITISSGSKNLVMVQLLRNGFSGLNGIQKQSLVCMYYMYWCVCKDEFLHSLSLLHYITVSFISVSLP